MQNWDLFPRILCTAYQTQRPPSRKSNHSNRAVMLCFARFPGFVVLSCFVLCFESAQQLEQWRPLNGTFRELRFRRTLLEESPCPKGTVLEGGECTSYNASIGVMVPLRWGLEEAAIEPRYLRHAAAAAMAAYHINHRVSALVPEAAQLLPAGFKFDYDLRDSHALPSVAVEHVVEWHEEGKQVIVGSWRSAVTGPLALVASIEATPVIAWAAHASTMADRETYPTLSRTAVGDVVLADRTIQSITLMGWTQIAIIYVDDAWGRGFMRETTDAASRWGVNVAAVAGFALNSVPDIEQAVAQIAESSAHIILCVAFDLDLGSIALISGDLGLQQSGYAWIITQPFSVEAVLHSSPDPARAHECIRGWFVVSIDPMAGELGPRFQSVLESEPLEHLNSSVLRGELTAEVVYGEDCDYFCGTIYDAMWTSAIAISQMEVGDDGSIDKQALLHHIRNVSFEGATGRVRYTQNGERDPEGQPLILKNLRPSHSADSNESLVLVPTWRLQSGNAVLEPISERPPLWPGGEQAWQLPVEILDCEQGFVFSLSSLQCEACPRGKLQEGRACVKYDASVGVLVPLRWGSGNVTMDPRHLRHAYMAALAAKHVNERVTTLVPRAKELLPAGFKLVVDIQDSMAMPSVAVDHAVQWKDEETHVIVGSFRSAVTGPLALAASIDATPVISWGSSSSELTDRATFPTLTTARVNDAVVADLTIRSIISWGWTRIAIMYLNDAWGRGGFRELSDTGSRLGVEITFAFGFELGDQAQIERGVSEIAASGARIILTLAFDADVAVIANAADSHGLLSSGHAWISVYPFSLQTVLSQSPDPKKLTRQLVGWLVVAMDAFQSDPSLSPRFLSVLEEEDLHRLSDSVPPSALPQEAIWGVECDQFCGLVYDSVWTAAIAIGRMGPTEDSRVDKVALLAAIRNVSFEGATGRVQYSEGGQRAAHDQPLLIRNLRPTPSETGEQTLSMVVTWKTWQSGLLEAVISDPPLWPGGEQAWQLPVEILDCEQGFVFSLSSLQCEACPRGTVQEGRACVKYDASVGVMVPLRWGSEDEAIAPWHMRHAASAVMAAHHINERTTTLVPRAKELLPAGFKFVFDLQDTMGLPSTAVDHVVAWNADGQHVIVGSYRSEVTASAALAASISATPVVVWAASASALSNRDTFPFLSRTVVNDAVHAKSTMQSIRALGWTRVAILYVDDQWGRGFMQDALNSGRSVGVDIGVVAKFSLSDSAEIDLAVSELAQSGLAVTICVVFPSDVAAVAEAADRHDMLTTGHAWITLLDVNVEEIVAGRKDAEETRRRLSGWLSATTDPLFGDRRARFQTALDEEPLPNLNHSALGSQLSRDVLADGSCDEFCAGIYDAMWTSAIAISQMEVGDDGSIDKQALLHHIRTVSFEGATGQVEYDGNGERMSTTLPLIIKNFRAVLGSDLTSSLVAVATWRFLSEALEPISEEPPQWPGGEQAWQLPVEILDCEQGFVFSLSSLQCEACPRGTVQEGRACVKYDASVGVMVPLSWGGSETGWGSRHAAAAAMAAHHINERVTTLVPRAKELLPAGFKLVVDIQDSMAMPSVAVDHVVAWHDDGKHAIVGPYRSAVAGPAALAASIEGTPVIAYSATASALAEQNTYPTLSRTVVADNVLAENLVGCFQSLGWNRIAILYLRETWGRGLAQDVTATASRLGVEVVSVADFGDSSEIDDAVASVEASQARIIACFIDNSDLAAVAEAAERHGMLSKGFAWILALETGIAEAIVASPEPDKTRDRLSGWFTAGFDELLGTRKDRFQMALESEPSSTFDAYALEGVFGGVCDRYCGTVYDAVWLAAIGISRADAGDSAPTERAKTQETTTKVDTALLASIRNTSFEGATGWVRLDGQTGERSHDSSLHPVLLKNLRADARRAEWATISMVLTWQWSMREGGASHLERLDRSAPLWPGGERDWAPPPDSIICPEGYVFDNVSLSCEPCPPGTEQRERKCVLCRPGHVAPHAAMKQCIQCGSVGYANESGMDRCHVCVGNRKINASILNATSSDQCVCNEGYVDAACTLPVWQVLVIALVVIGVPAVGFCVQRLFWLARSSDVETLRIEQQVTLIRAKLRIRREDGFLMTGESRTWSQTLRFADTTHLPVKYLDNTARLALMLPFEVEAIDLLAAQLHIHEDKRDEADDESSFRGRSPAGVQQMSFLSRARRRFGATRKPERFARQAANTESFERYLALCKLVLEVSEWLLDPEEKSCSDVESNRSGATPRFGQMFRRSQGLLSISDQKAGMLSPESRSASERFEFFKDRVAKLSLWNHHNNFQKLKSRIQVWMDDLRRSMDRLFETIQNEPGGPALVQFQGPWEELAQNGVREARGEHDRIHRQDHDQVRAVRVDDEALAEFELQLPPEPRPTSPQPSSMLSSPGIYQHFFYPSSMRLSDPAVTASGQHLGNVHRDSMHLPADAENLSTAAAARIRFNELLRQLQGPPTPSSEPSTSTPDAARTHRRSLPELDRTAGSADHMTFKVDGEDSVVSVVCDIGIKADLEREFSAQAHPRRAVALVGEEGFIQQLHLRAGLLDDEFQRAVQRGIASAGDDVIDDGGLGVERLPSHNPQTKSFTVKKVRVVTAPIKTPLRMREKVKQYAEEMHSQEQPEQFLPYTAHILDPVRCSVVCRNSTGILQHAKWLVEHGESCGLPVVRAKNKFAVVDSSEYDGYRDLMLSVLFTGRKGLRIIGEIQLHDERMYPLKVKMHRLYKVKRATCASAI